MTKLNQLIYLVIDSDYMSVRRKTSHIIVATLGLYNTSFTISLLRKKICMTIFYLNICVPGKRTT